jgi:solute:Na+ symporter, SSS family
MSERSLGSLQVAALLVSASYGIGFLFGSGELALMHGMAGSIYGVATAVGMLVLALFASRLWRAGLPIWEMFGRAYGHRLQSAVALLSIVWMAGVLAAQIHGGLAVVGLLGLSGPMAYGLVLTLIYIASRLDLRVASGVFAACLVASGLVLVYALVAANGVPIYASAVPAFVQDLSSFKPTRLLALVLAVGILVCTGADYHQFVLAARRPRAATFGCILAGLGLLLIGFLPAAVVLAMDRAGSLHGLADAKQVVPFALAQVAGTFGAGADKVLLGALSAAALGSGAAIVRAMTSALASATPGAQRASQPVLAAVSIAVGAALAARDQGIVDTMVSVNVIYIASVGAVFAALLRGIVVPVGHAGAIMATGFSVAFATYVAGWAGWLGESADIVSLVSGLGASAAMAVCCALSANRVPRGGSSVRG